MPDGQPFADALASVTAEPGVSKPDPILVIDEVSRTFGGLQAVDVDHLEIQRGQITALIGPNGAGKTTFFNLLTGFDHPDTGRWDFDGTDISDWPPYELARQGMVRTFQLTKALQRLTVADNMKLGAPDQTGERLAWALFASRWKGQEERNEEKAEQLLERFKLSHMTDDYAGTLSGGQRKLLEMARALMVDPTLVMLDEPMAGVNPVLTQSLLEHITGLRDEGMTVVFVEHDMDVVMGISDWVVCMAEGRIIAEGLPDSVASDPEVVDAYLGQHHDEGGASRPSASLQSQIDSHREQETPTPVIDVQGIVAGYLPGLNILDDCDLRLDDGELVGIIGPNGAGKSTLVKAIFGLVEIRSGQVLLHGDDVTNTAGHLLVERGLGYVPQTENVFPSLTVGENLQMGLYLRPKDFGERFEEVTELFPRLAERRYQRAASLSGGERQMVAMARALMMRPRVLLLDEPSAGLSPANQDEVFDRVRGINETGVSIIMVEQNARNCLEIAHRGYVLDQGHNAYTGAGRELLHDPKVIELYLGTLATAD